ncbi:hypothetical protein ST201phi2-1p088 [Pseudomonas phage 201phi2-1]|uniref:Uncharacterized protein n=1 Tax=Pseudomonas phage 201phi2-1 TaxID=198110 RepID=B3FIV2_BP201|nr:hypothetical protein ST201phi2-1p088 [Pseudomonas phage 201phi2-1]ABY62921.1 hypothetical protein 201phi2-1p088 [Pseudomonas phage 201phi2-1]
MSTVIPKDLTGLVKHPTKLDCWIPGEARNGKNLCMEIPLGKNMECTLGKPDLSKLTHNHLTQIQMELWNNRGGGPEGKIINSFYAGATPEQLMSSEEVQDHTDDLIHYLGDAKRASDYIDQLLRDVRHHIVEKDIMPYEMPANNKSTMEVFNEISLDWKTQIYNNVVKRFGGEPSTYLQGITKDTNLPEMAVEEFANVVIKEHDNDPKVAAEILKAAITEHITMMSSVMINNALKEKGLMGQITKVTDNMIEQVNAKTELNEQIKATLDDISQVTIDSTKHKEVAPTEDQFHNPKHVKFDDKGNVIRKKKGKRKSQHIPNMKNKSVKRALGASILHMLGDVQRKTQDANKRELLKALPLADVVEMATGDKLPDYQANLLNAMQAKADPTAPIVERMAKTSEPDPYEKLLDETVSKYISRDLLPAEISDEQAIEIIASVKKSFLDNHKLPTPESIWIADGIVHSDFSKGTDYIPVSVDFTGEKVRDLYVNVEDQKYFLHYEWFTEYAADHMGTTIAFIQDRLDVKYWDGLKAAVIESVTDLYPSWKAEFTNEEIHSLIYKVVTGYTVGFVQGLVDTEHKLRASINAETVTAADLG